MTGRKRHQCEVVFLQQGCVRLANPVLLALPATPNRYWMKRKKKLREQVISYYGV